MSLRDTKGQNRRQTLEVLALRSSSIRSASKLDAMPGRARQGVALGVAVLLSATGAACADGGGRAIATGVATPAAIREVSTLRYVNNGVTAVVRLTAPIAANESAFFVDASLRVGQTPGTNQGVEPAERIGAKGRDCYFVSARRLVPVKTPKPGSTTKFGFAAKAEGKSGKLTDVVPARFAQRHGAGWQFAAAERMGCGDSR